jgi:predicted house-cleaning NTP pyrophosphatase (Maf/HAM1 superfamily)
MEYPFIENKYTKWYISIIENSKSRLLVESYYENHHIIPRSLGGTNLKENLVRLTVREHYICHLLLRKMVTGTAKHKMIHAAFMMCKCRNNILVVSRTTELLRRELQGLPKTNEHKSNISKSKIGHKQSLYTKKLISKKKLGVPLTQEHKDAISKGTIQRYIDNPMSDESKLKVSVANKGKILTNETKTKIGIASKGRIQSGAKTWILQDPSGNIHDVYCLKSFCDNLNIRWKPLSDAEFNVPVVKGISKGWIVISKN